MELTITKRDGTKIPFNADRINRSIERAALGMIDPIAKVTQVATDTHVTLYDGITTEELDLATINAAVQNIKDDVVLQVDGDFIKDFVINIIISSFFNVIRLKTLLDWIFVRSYKQFFNFIVINIEMYLFKRSLVLG